MFNKFSKKLLTEYKKKVIIIFSKKTKERKIGGRRMRKILSILSLEFNIFLINNSFYFSFKDIFILKFINFYFRNGMTI